MNETKFIELYTEITACSEGRARSVYILLCDETDHRSNILLNSRSNPISHLPLPVQNSARLPIGVARFNPLPALRPSL